MQRAFFLFSETSIEGEGGAESRLLSIENFKDLVQGGVCMLFPSYLLLFESHKP
jgi:hypothetical protein